MAIGIGSHQHELAEVGGLLGCALRGPSKLLVVGERQQEWKDLEGTEPQLFYDATVTRSLAMIGMPRDVLDV